MKYEAHADAHRAESLALDIERLHAEALARGHGDLHAAHDWLMYEWRGPLSYCISAYEDAVRGTVFAQLTKTMTEAQREAVALDITAVELAAMTATVARRHTVGAMTIPQRLEVAA